MRRFGIVLAGVLLLAGGAPAQESKAQQLERLKKERAALDERIRKLEAEEGAPPAAEPPSVAAQPPVPPVSRPAEPRGRILVTDTRLETDPAASGRSVTVIDSGALEASGKRQAQDVLREVPGLQVVRSGMVGGTTSLYTRGGESNHTMVMVDGVRINKDGGTYDYESLGVDEVDRVEVIRGAGSALYGSDAMAGMVNFVTRRGEGPPTLRTSFEYGTFQAMRERVSVSGGDDRIGYRLGGSNLQQRGTVFPNSDFDARNFAGRFDARLAPDLDMTFSARTLESHHGLYSTSAGQDTEPADPNDSKDRSNALVSLGFRSRVSPVWVSRLTLSRFTDTVKFNLRKEPGEVSEFSDYYSLTDFSRQGGSWQNDWTLPHGHTLTAGLDYEAEAYHQVTTTIGTASDSGTQTNRSRTDRAVFLQDVWTWDKRLTLSASGRRNENSDFGTEHTGQAALSWKTADSGPRLHTSQGRGVKIPTFYEIYGDAWATGLKLTPRGVRVARSRTGDVGVEQAFGWLTLDATWFEHRYDDLVEFSGTGYYQGGTSVARGWEFGVDADPSAKWHLHGDLTVMDTKVTATTTTGTTTVENEELVRRPRLQGNASVAYRPMEDLTGRLGMRYVGSRVDLDYGQSASGFRVYQPSHTLFDASASWRLPGRARPWRVFLTVDNLLDLQYEEIVGFPSPGFTMMGGVEYRHEF